MLSVVQMAAVGEEFSPLHTIYPVAALVRETGTAARLDELRTVLRPLVRIDIRG